MFSNYRRIISALAIATIIASGCSKSSSPSSPPTTTTPTPPSITFKGPNTNSSDTYAQMVKSMAASFTGLTSLYSPYFATNPKQNGSTWTWTVTEPPSLTATFTATKQSDGSFVWKLVLNGKSSSDSTTYNNWTALQGTSSADGKNGDWKVYQTNTTILAGEFIWSTDNAGKLTGTLRSYSETGTLSGSIAIINNSDGSGEIDEYDGNALVFKAVWTSSGSGTWWSYNNGTQTGTGTWT
jgi:hypothetical protein